MKKFILLAGLCFMTGVSAQVESLQQEPQQLNIVKTNVPAYAFRNLNISYERVINQWFSISGGVNYMPKGKIPFLEQFNFSDNNDLKDFDNTEISNVAITIEPRFYVGKGYGKGFYLAPYYRYTSLDLDNISVTFKDDNNQDMSVDISGNASANSFGLMIGSQWFLGEKQNWVLDWWIIGAHYGFAKGDFNGKSSRLLTEKEQNDFQKELDNFDAPFVKYKSTVNANGANVDLDGPWGGLRAGLAIGYRF